MQFYTDYIDDELQNSSHPDHTCASILQNMLQGSLLYDVQNEPQKQGETLFNCIIPDQRAIAECLSAYSLQLRREICAISQVYINRFKVEHGIIDSQADDSDPNDPYGLDLWQPEDDEAEYLPDFTLENTDEDKAYIANARDEFVRKYISVFSVSLVNQVASFDA